MFALAARVVITGLGDRGKINIEIFITKYFEINRNDYSCYGKY